MTELADGGADELGALILLLAVLILLGIVLWHIQRCWSCCR